MAADKDAASKAAVKDVIACRCSYRYFILAVVLDIHAKKQ
jgi:hypothetical protein